MLEIDWQTDLKKLLVFKRYFSILLHSYYISKNCDEHKSLA